MPDPTDRLGLNTYSQGETSWDHTDLVEKVDELAIDRGAIADRPATGDYDDQLYYAVDQRTLWRWDETGSDWNAAGGLGASGSRIPGTTYREKLDAQEVSTEDADIDSLGVVETDERNLSAFQNVGRMWDAMEHSISGSAFGPWSLVSGSWETDSQNFHSGTQSLKLTGGASGALIRQSNIDFDLTSKRFAVMGMLDPGGSGVDVEITVRDGSDDEGTLKTEWYSQDASESRGFMYHNFGIDDVDPSLDGTEIDEIDISFSSEDVLWIDAIKTVPVPSPGRILIDFDAASKADAYDVYRPILAEYGYAPTAASGQWHNLGESGMMTEDEARELIEDYGWRLRPHIGFRSNLFNPGNFPYSDDDYREQILENLGRLFDHRGPFRLGMRHFSFLGNETNWESMQVVQDYALTARRRGGGVIGYPVNPLDIPADPFDNGLSDVQSRIEICAEYGGFYRIYAHTDSRLGASDARAVFDLIQGYEEDGELVVTNQVDAYEDWLAQARTAREQGNVTKVYQTSNQALPADSFETVAFDSVSDNYGPAEPVTSDDRIDIKQPGTYLITASVSLAGSLTEELNVRILAGGATAEETRADFAGHTTFPTVKLQTVERIQVGTRIRLSVRQRSSGSIDTNTGEEFTNLAVIKID